MKEKSVGLQLSFLRKERGVSQREIAKKLGKNPPTISMLESQKMPRIPTIKEYLGVLDLECYLVVRDKEGKEVNIEL